LNPLVVALVTPPALTVRVYPSPVLLMLSVEKLATPAVAVTTVVPDSVPPPALFPKAIVMPPVNPDATLLDPSRAWTTTAGAIATPATVLPGWTEKMRCVAVLAKMLNALLVAAVRAPEVAPSVYPVPTRLMLRSLNVATPATAARVSVPDSVPLEGFVPIATTTLAVYVRFVLPNASCAATTTAGVIEAPAPVLTGCVVMTRWVAAAATMLKLALVAPVRAPEDVVSV
jgi:hypothetical protein